MKKMELLALEALLSVAINNVRNDQNPEQNTDSIRLLEAAHTIMWRDLGKQRVATAKELSDSVRILKGLVPDDTASRTGLIQQPK